MKIYKYASLDTAFKILEQERVLLNPPSKFKDIKDSTINISNKTQKRTIDLIKNYGMFKAIYDFAYSLDLSGKFRGKGVIKWFKWQCSLYLKALSLNKTYEPMKMMNFIYFLLRKRLPEIEELLKNAEYLYKYKTIPNIIDVRQKARITCFSKTPTNLYCWNEYGDGHRGICFEFEEDRDFFKEVIYSDKNEEMDIYNATAKILAYNLLGEELTYKEKDFSNAMLRPFFVKSTMYRKEDEVRCLLSSNESEKIGYVVEKDKTYLKMKIKRVYVGCRISDAHKIVEFLRECDSKNIPITYLDFNSQTNTFKETTLSLNPKD